MRFAEAIRAISAFGGRAVRHASILAVRWRLDIMPLPVNVVAVLHERRFLWSLAVVLVAWRPSE